MFENEKAFIRAISIYSNRNYQIQPYWPVATILSPVAEVMVERGTSPSYFTFPHLNSIKATKLDRVSLNPL